MVSQTTLLCAAKLSSVSTAVFDHIVDLQVRVEISLPVAHISLDLDGGLGDEILVVGIDVSIVVGVSIVVVQCGDDGHAPPPLRSNNIRSRLQSLGLGIDDFISTLKGYQNTPLSQRV